MPVKWTEGNAFELLENGEEFFPAVFEAIAAAQRSVVIETFIIFDDEVGKALKEAVVGAAQRGVQIDITVDGYGTADLPESYIKSLTEAGVRFHIFDPQPKRLGFRTNLFRRLHRKIVVVDSELAFIGGINFGADHLIKTGPQAKQDYAVKIRGPVVGDIEADALKLLTASDLGRTFWRRLRWRRRHRYTEPGGIVAAWVSRDNDEHTDDIERHYRFVIRAAQKQITIANAYFFPGYKLLRDMRRAAKRGVDVRLILQGEPDMPWVRSAATLLYDYLLSGGVKIYEYCERPFHGKVATVDGQWATVGSSNLDPLSLALNLEGNVMIRDTQFAACLQEKLEDLVENQCQLMERGSRPKRRIQRMIVGVFVFHFLRRFPAWAGLFPARKPQLTSLEGDIDKLHEVKS
ncbi:MAG TPA: cardiolipin synthase ClsB [Burkholderiaceae bacterium]|nr:cardiolipin synthase ClsB [Burkholderiaceae bacterium]